MASAIAAVMIANIGSENAIVLRQDSKSSANGEFVAGVDVGGPFELVRAPDSIVTLDSFQGRLALIYFGYTFCPDVCPTELQSISAALDLLGPLAEQVSPIFITIDPERDTAEVMRAYVAAIDRRLVGLSGSPAQISAASKSFRVFAQRVSNQETPGSYLMDHSAFVYLLDRTGKTQKLFAPNSSPETIANAIKTLAASTP